jgi:hypothetical protein
MKRRRKEASIQNPFPADIWNIITDYAQQFECRLVSKKVIDGKMFLLGEQFFVKKDNLCVSWPQEDVSFDVSNKFKCKSHGVWWSKTEQKLEYWNQDGILEDSCTCERMPFENQCSKYPCFEINDRRIYCVRGRFYKSPFDPQYTYTLTSEYCVAQKNESLVFTHLTNPSESIEVPFKKTRWFVDGNPERYIAEDLLHGQLYSVEESEEYLVSSPSRNIISIVPIVSNTFVVLMYGRPLAKGSKEIVLCHVPTATETLIMKDHHDHISLSFVGQLFLIVAAHDVIRVFKWEDSSLRYCGCITGSITHKIAYKWNDVFFVNKRTLYIIYKDPYKSFFREYH